MRTGVALRVCMCVDLYISTSVRAYSVYTMGWDPGGRQCHVKVTLEGKMGRERPPACWQWQNEGDSHPPV